MWHAPGVGDGEEDGDSTCKSVISCIGDLFNKLSCEGGRIKRYRETKKVKM